MQLSWDAFLARYRPLARAIAVSLARTSAEADDVVQEASLALFSAAAREPERFTTSEHARNYFLRSVRNLALRTHRETARAAPLESEPAAKSPASEATPAADRPKAVDSSGIMTAGAERITYW